MLNVEDILDKSSTEQAVIVTTRVERTDIQKCYIKVKVSGEYTKDAIIKIQKEQSECNDGYDIITDYDDKLDAYYFWGKVQNMYYLEISKKDCFPQTKNVFLQGQNNHVIEFTLINCVETMLKF